MSANRLRHKPHKTPIYLAWNSAAACQHRSTCSYSLHVPSLLTFPSIFFILLKKTLELRWPKRSPSLIILELEHSREFASKGRYINLHNEWINELAYKGTYMHTTFIHTYTHSQGSIHCCLKYVRLTFSWLRGCWWSNEEDDGDAEMRTPRWGRNGNGYKEKKTTKIRSTRYVGLLQILLGLYMFNCRVDFSCAWMLSNARRLRQHYWDN